MLEHSTQAAVVASLLSNRAHLVDGLEASMLIELGQVEAIFRYPVKSMAGERLETANLGWHGLDGDRRLALRRIEDRSGMPWLTASEFPDLLRFAPHRSEGTADAGLPTHVRTPDGEEMPVFSEDLAKEIGRRYGAPVQMMQLRHGIYDEASISVIASDTVREIGRLAGRSLDVRRFRPNVVVRLQRSSSQIAKEDIRRNRDNVGERLGFLGRVIHGMDPRAWLKEMRQLLGEKVDFASAAAD
jgi:MOSC domain-containing protein